VRIILGAIGALPAYQRQPFLMHYRDGRSYSEIAAEEHIPLGTVRSRLSRARTELKRRLTELAAGG
jgi:RNA polymerase sigma-70 factor (ECF subfamily)